MPQGSPKGVWVSHRDFREKLGSGGGEGENSKHLPNFTGQKVRENPMYESPCVGISESLRCSTQAAMQAPARTEEPICCSCMPAVRLRVQGDLRVGTMLLSACLQVERGTRAGLWRPTQIYQTTRPPHPRVKPEMATFVSSCLEGIENKLLSWLAFHRITEWFGWEVDLKDHLVQITCHGQGQFSSTVDQVV